MRILRHKVIVSVIVTLGMLTARGAQAQTTVPAVQAGTISETLGTLTQFAGNPGVGEVLAGLTGMEVATAPFGSPSGGFVFSYDRESGVLVRRSRTFGPNFLERATTTGRRKGDVPFAAEVGESGRLLCTPILSSDVATFLRGAGRDELMKRVGQRGHLAKPAHATKLLFCLEDR